jgi:hypothetical protein
LQLTTAVFLLKTRQGMSTAGRRSPLIRLRVDAGESAP